MEFVEAEDENGFTYDCVTITDAAWTWIDSNDSLFSLFREEKAPELAEDDVPF